MDIFNGQDGKPSGRRIIGAVLISWGGILLSINVAQAMPENLEILHVVWKLGPGALLVLAGAFFWGLVTMQNLGQLAEKVKKDGK